MWACKNEDLNAIVSVLGTGNARLACPVNDAAMSPPQESNEAIDLIRGSEP